MAVRHNFRWFIDWNLLQVSLFFDTYRSEAAKETLDLGPYFEPAWSSSFLDPLILCTRAIWPVGSIQALVIIVMHE